MDLAVRMVWTAVLVLFVGFEFATGVVVGRGEMIRQSVDPTSYWMYFYVHAGAVVISAVIPW